MSDEEQIKRAITHLKAQKLLNIAAASKQFKIPHMTLPAHFHGQKGLHQKATANTHLKLCSAQKKTLIVYINKLSNYELSSISEIVRNLVHKLLKLRLMNIVGCKTGLVGLDFKVGQSNLHRLEVKVFVKNPTQNLIDRSADSNELLSLPR